MTTRLNIGGRVTLRGYREGALVYDHVVGNLITDAGRTHILSILSGAYSGSATVAALAIDTVVVGTGTASPSSADTALGAQVASKSATVTLDTANATFSITLGTGDANANTLAEVGLIAQDDAAADVLVGRALIPLYAKTSADTLVIDYSLYIET